MRETTGLTTTKRVSNDTNAWACIPQNPLKKTVTNKRKTAPPHIGMCMSIPTKAKSFHPAPICQLTDVSDMRFACHIIGKFKPINHVIYGEENLL